MLPEVRLWLQSRPLREATGRLSVMSSRGFRFARWRWRFLGLSRRTVGQYTAEIVVEAMDGPMRAPRQPLGEAGWPDYLFPPSLACRALLGPFGAAPHHILARPLKPDAVPLAARLLTITLEPPQAFEGRRLFAGPLGEFLGEAFGVLGPEFHPEPSAGDGGIKILAVNETRVQRREHIDAVIGLRLR